MLVTMIRKPYRNNPFSRLCGNPDYAFQDVHFTLEMYYSFGGRQSIVIGDYIHKYHLHIANELLERQ